MNYQIYCYNLEGDQDLVIKACDWDSPVDKNGCINVKSKKAGLLQTFEKILHKH